MSPSFGQADPSTPAAAAEDPTAQMDWTWFIHFMSQVRPTSSVTESARLFCESVRELPGLDGAMIILWPVRGREAVHVTNSGPEIAGFSDGSTFAVERLESIAALTEHGAWYLDFSDPGTRSLVGSELVDAIVQSGITASAYGGLTSKGQVLGVLAIASTDPDGAAVLSSKLPLIEQLAGLAGAVLGAQAERFVADESRRQAIAELIDQRALRTVFQPVVRLPKAEICGYEALTRFDNGSPPDVVIAEAHEVGLGLELEELCIDVALQSVDRLAPGMFLSLNMSAQTVLAGTAARALAAYDQQMVVELTEHAEVTDYPAVRETLANYPNLKLAVDDAGAGFASMRHILELAPAYVKLDRGLVHNVDTDPARDALVAGMRHFANLTGTELIAEGVETAREATVLEWLGVELAQGYFFGRPQPL